MKDIQDLIDEIDPDCEEEDDDQPQETQPLEDSILDAVVSGVPEQLMPVLASLGLDQEKLNALREQLIEKESKKVVRPVQEAYAEYRLQIAAITRDLERVSRAAMYPSKGGKKNYRVAVDALKAKAAVIDKMVLRGQELGVLPTASKNSKVQHSGAVLFATMSEPELIARMKELSDEKARIDKSFKEIPFTDLPIPDIYGSGDVIDAVPLPAVDSKPAKRRVKV